MYRSHIALLQLSTLVSVSLLASSCGLLAENAEQSDGAVARKGDVHDAGLKKTGSTIKPQIGTKEQVSAKPVVPQKPVKASFPARTLGLRLKRSIVVRSGPSLDAEKLGTVAAHTIVGWNSAVKAEGCETRWIAIEPKGWVCEGYLEPVKKRPRGVELPKLGTAESVPGTYGKVIGEEAVVVTIKDGAIISESGILGASTVRKRGLTMIEELPYWKIDGGKYIAEESLRLHKPSEFGGTRLQGVVPPTFPLAFAYSSNRPGDWVVVRNDKDQKVRRLKARALVSIKEEKIAADGHVSRYQIGDNEFVLAKDLRLIELHEPPDRTGPHERWFDIDLSTQVLVAYEGTLPVYTTLISSGTRKNPTETGIFRIWIKFSETTMSGRMGESDAYSVATVPWTQFYENDFALHTSYWHNSFGQQRSHGCINLSPKDARFVYFWSDPQVPIGWSMANSSTQSPGSIVRVHSKADPDPEYKGRAKVVYDARE